MESQLAIIFERILRLDQRPGRDFEPVDEAGQEEAQRGAATERRQRRDLGSIERTCAPVAAKERTAFGDVVGMIGLEAPRVEADRDVIGERVAAGEIEIDQARKA